MPETPVTPVETPAAVATPPETKPAETPVAATPAPEAPKANPWEDPKAAQAEIERLRKENAKDRTTSKAQAADEARAEMAQAVAKALGLVKDEPMDPAKLAEEVSAHKTAAQQARVELAVFRNASAANGDPAALLDSTGFLKSLASIDPSDAAAVTAAIEAAVAANPRLGAVTDPRSPAHNPAQGSSASGPVALGQLTRADLAGMTPDAIEKARVDGRLNEALGIKS